jgi:hypothetical protein
VIEVKRKLNALLEQLVPTSAGRRAASQGGRRK